MPWPTPSRSAQRYLGNAKEKVVHDLLNEQPECEALAIIADGKGERFIPDQVELALALGYKACPHCLPDLAEAEEPAGDDEGTTPLAGQRAEKGIVKEARANRAPQKAAEKAEA